MTPRDKALFSLGLLLAILVTYGGLVFAKIYVRNGCICLRPNQIMQPLSAASMQEAIPVPRPKACCTR